MGWTEQQYEKLISGPQCTITFRAIGCMFFYKKYSDCGFFDGIPRLS